MKYAALIALIVSVPAYAVDLEMSVGQTQYTKVDNTNWWQAGPASQGFSDNFNLTTTAFTIGITDKYSQHVNWRVGYADLGRATSVAMATATDSMYNISTQSCNPGCRMNKFVGNSDSDGVYATAQYITDVGLFAEAGLWIYRNNLNMTATSGVGLYSVPAEDTFQVGPVVGVGYKKNNVSIAATVYEVQRTGQWPGIFTGYASVVSIRYKF